MAWLYLRNETWYLGWYENGRKRGKRISKDREIAEFALARHERERDLAPWLPSALDVPIKKITELWTTYAETNCRPSSQKRYKAVVDRFETFCEQEEITDVSELNLEQAEKYKTWRKKKVKAGTVNTELTIINAMFLHAVRLEVANRVPWEHVKRLKKTKKAPRTYTKKEIKQVLALLPSWAADSVQILLYTGMRFGELRALRWEDVDLRRKMIVVSSSDEHETKTGGVWAVPISSKLIPLLKRRKKLKDPWVVKQPGGRGPIHHSRLRDLFQAALTKAGLPRGTIHDLRHTFASRLIEAGAAKESVQELLGHESIASTDIYTHLSAGHLREQIDRL